MDNERNFLENISDEDNKKLIWLKEKSGKFIRLMSYYRCAMMEIETKFNVLNVEYSLRHDRKPINGMSSRLKSPQSIGEKLLRKGVDISIDAVENNLNDVAGVRVVCSFVEDVWTLEKALLKQDDVTLIERKDYITNPKPNGYRSLHLILSIPIFLSNEKRNVKVEVQLRTIAMDCWASLEHQIRYKKDFEMNEKMSEDLSLCAKLSAELDSRMDALRNKLEL